MLGRVDPACLRLGCVWRGAAVRTCGMSEDLHGLNMLPGAYSWHHHKSASPLTGPHALPMPFQVHCSEHQHRGLLLRTLIIASLRLVGMSVCNTLGSAVSLLGVPVPKNVFLCLRQERAEASVGRVASASPRLGDITNLHVSAQVPQV